MNNTAFPRDLQIHGFSSINLGKAVRIKTEISLSFPSSFSLRKHKDHEPRATWRCRYFFFINSQRLQDGQCQVAPAPKSFADYLNYFFINYH